MPLPFGWYLLFKRAHASQTADHGTWLRHPIELVPPTSRAEYEAMVGEREAIYSGLIKLALRYQFGRGVAYNIKLATITFLKAWDIQSDAVIAAFLCHINVCYEKKYRERALEHSQQAKYYQTYAQQLGYQAEHRQLFIKNYLPMVCDDWAEIVSHKLQSAVSPQPPRNPDKSLVCNKNDGDKIDLLDETFTSIQVSRSWDDESELLANKLRKLYLSRGRPCQLTRLELKMDFSDNAALHFSALFLSRDWPITTLAISGVTWDPAAKKFFPGLLNAFDKRSFLFWNHSSFKTHGQKNYLITSNSAPYLVSSNCIFTGRSHIVF